jgi:hypothetical protein
MNQGMYVEGYNYHNMYNIMANHIIENLIPVDNFIYTFQQVNALYDFLTPLVMNDIANEIANQNNMNQDIINNPVMNPVIDQVDNIDIINNINNYINNIIYIINPQNNIPQI